MKYLYSLVALFITLQLTGQSGTKSAELLAKEFARNCAHLEWRQLIQTGSRLAKTQKLDSVVTKDAFSITTQKIEADYNTDGHTIQMKQYGPDTLTSIVELQGRFTFEYIDKDYPSYIAIETYNNTTQQYSKQFEFEIHYDNAHRVDSLVISLPDPFSGVYEKTLATKQVYTGNLLTQTREWLYFSLFGFWIPSSQTDYQYDGMDRLIDQITSTFDLGTGEIVPDTRTTDTYNATGKQDTVTNYTWSGTVWDPTDRTSYTYFNNGTIKNEIVQIVVDSMWQNNVWTSYAVENVNDKYPSTGYNWDTVNAKWVKTDSTVNLLNPSLLWGQVAAPRELSVLDAAGFAVGTSFNEDDASVLETRYFLADTLSHQLFYDSKDIYYYSLFGQSSVNTILPDYINVSPNPAQSQFTIVVDSDTKATYTVYSTTGTLVDKGEITFGKNIVSVSGWLPGVYYVKIRLQDGTTFIHKQIKG